VSTLLAFVRANTAVDPIGGLVADVPIVPGTWDVVVESNRWSSIYPLGRVGGPCFFARLIARQSGQPGRAMFVCIGPAVMLTRLANQIASDGLGFTQTWANLAALRADGGAVALGIKAAWPDERPGGAGTLVALWARMAGLDSEDGET